MSNEIYMCKESGLVPLEDADGNEVPTLFTKGKTTVRKGHQVLKKWPEMFEPLKVDYDLDDDEPGGPVAAVKKAVKRNGKRTSKKTVAEEKAAAQATDEKTAEQVKADDPSNVPSRPLLGAFKNPPAGGVGNQDPAGEGGPEKLADGNKAPALTDDPDNA